MKPTQARYSGLGRSSVSRIPFTSSRYEILTSVSYSRVRKEEHLGGLGLVRISINNAMLEPSCGAQSKSPSAHQTNTVTLQIIIIVAETSRKLK